MLVSEGVGGGGRGGSEGYVHVCLLVHWVLKSLLDKKMQREDSNAPFALEFAATDITVESGGGETNRI